ncbi:MAG: phage virion morphogenesis protein [Immundisolibacter sp.]|uniref:phage virion morphogenesis protein n=1 Tax=Immundisolibacter sp. TaxID=1934948 RepID=UPI0019AE4928|nr:phage virion morphogenesis protein [Immundisolibacter sp.]MBC7162704.1 phage virion morphogenesis protein [Immundisolibacter sp.]
MARITFDIDDAQTRADIGRILGLLQNPTQALDDIGEYLIVSTKARFGAGVAPSGVKWKDNSPITLARKKDTRPLHGESGRLGREILKFVDQAEVEVGSNLIYAAVQQFGAKMGEFGRYSQLSRRTKFAEGDWRRNAGTVKGFPIPWGDIPARPFLGLSAEDVRAVLDIVQKHIEGDG